MRFSFVIAAVLAVFVSLSANAQKSSTKYVEAAELTLVGNLFFMGETKNLVYPRVSCGS